MSGDWGDVPPGKLRGPPPPGKLRGRPPLPGNLMKWPHSKKKIKCQVNYILFYPLLPH